MADRTGRNNRAELTDIASRTGKDSHPELTDHAGQNWQTALTNQNCQTDLADRTGTQNCKTELAETHIQNWRAELADRMQAGGVFYDSTTIL